MPFNYCVEYIKDKMFFIAQCQDPSKMEYTVTFYTQTQSNVLMSNTL